MISKIRKRDNNWEKEIEISEKIKKIRNYSYRFSPIEKWSEVTLGNSINDRTTNKNGREKTNIVCCQSRKPGKTIEEYIEDIGPTERTEEVIQSFEQYLRESVKLWNKIAPTLYLNLEPNNIRIDPINHVPIITEFISPKQTHYPIEYYIMTYTDQLFTAGEVFTKGQLFTRENAEDAFSQYYKNTPNQIITADEWIKMKEEYNRYIIPFIGKETREIKEMLKEEMTTWNYYTLSMVFLIIIRDTIHPINFSPSMKLFVEKQKKIIIQIPNERIKYMDM
jgi:hypothetical protein